MLCGIGQAVPPTPEPPTSVVPHEPARNARRRGSCIVAVTPRTSCRSRTRARSDSPSAMILSSPLLSSSASSSSAMVRHRLALPRVISSRTYARALSRSGYSPKRLPLSVSQNSYVAICVFPDLCRYTPTTSVTAARNRLGCPHTVWCPCRPTGPIITHSASNCSTLAIQRPSAGTPRAFFRAASSVLNIERPVHNSGLSRSTATGLRIPRSILESKSLGWASTSRTSR